MPLGAILRLPTSFHYIAKCIVHNTTFQPSWSSEDHKKQLTRPSSYSYLVQLAAVICVHASNTSLLSINLSYPMCQNTTAVAPSIQLHLPNKCFKKVEKDTTVTQHGSKNRSEKQRQLKTFFTFYVMSMGTSLTNPSLTLAVSTAVRIISTKTNKPTSFFRILIPSQDTIDK